MIYNKDNRLIKLNRKSTNSIFKYSELDTLVVSWQEMQTKNFDR